MGFGRFGLARTLLVRTVLARALLVACALAQPAQALDEATRRMVRDLSTEGVTAYQAGDYDKALERLEEAYSMLKTAPLAYWSAMALEKTGKLVEASERYLAAERAAIDPDGDPAPQRQAQADAKTAREALEPRIPRLTIQLSGASSAGAEVKVDGRPVPTHLVGHAISVNPGQLTVSATIDAKEVQKTVALAEGGSATVTLDLPNGGTPATAATAPAAQPKEPKNSGGSWQPLAGWIGIGTGAAGLAVGTITAVMVYDKRKALGCNSAGCPPDISDADRNQGEALRTVSATSYIVGGILVAAGVTLLLTAPKKPTAALQVSPTIGFGTVGLAGTF